MDYLYNYRKPWFKGFTHKMSPPIVGSCNEWALANERRKVAGSTMDKPSMEKYNEHGRGNGLRYGISCMQGWRGEMEDTHSAIISLGQDRGAWRNTSMLDWSYFGIFDGHAGDTVSCYCADQLLGSIIYSPEFQEDIVKGLRSGFLRLDARLRRLPDLAVGKDKSSSTAVVALISPYNIYIAHCGDSRAVLCNNGAVVFETNDHKPTCPKERNRIEELGGTITITESFSGLLNVSRFLGDFRYKQNEHGNPLDQIVIADPEVRVLCRNKNDNFLILACNGVWDVMSSEEVCSYVRHLMLQTDDLEFIGNSLTNTCLYKGSRDSISVIILALTGAPKPDDKFLLIEKRLDLLIENKVREMMMGHKEYISLPKIIEILKQSKLPYFPPGGGFHSKLPLVESIYNHLRPYRPESAIPWDVHDNNQLEQVILF